MAPVTVAGALVQQNAEALAGISFAQMVKKGAPVGYGGFTSNVDMKSGAPAFGTQHTQDRYKNAFYSPILSDWRNFETWAEAGSPTAMEKANKVWKERLASYEEPYMDPSIREELNAFVEKRRSEGGAPTDF
jgi:trimethylamine--corrinoid protein Co-methyltransferase